jgi:tight adherence protein B
MLEAMMILCEMIFLFCIFLIILNCTLKKKIDTENRLGELINEKKEEKRTVKVKRQNNLNAKIMKLFKNRKELEQMGEELYDIGIKIPIQTFVLMWLCVTIIIPAVLKIVGVSNIICVIMAFVIAFGPILYIRQKKKNRKKKLEGQLVEAIGVMSNALKAGHSFQTAMKNIAEDMEAPISEEFGRVFKETQRGMTLEESMNRMVSRTGSEDLNMICTAIIIQRKVGGNLAEVLEKISETVQSRIGLKAEIKTRTSSGRLSGYIVGALPILLLIIMTVLNKDYASTLFYTKAGNYMLIAGVVLEFIGFIAIKKIVSIKY